MAARPRPVMLKFLPLYFLALLKKYLLCSYYLSMPINRLLYQGIFTCICTLKLLNIHVTDYSIEGNCSIRVFRSFSMTCSFKGQLKWKIDLSLYARLVVVK